MKKITIAIDGYVATGKGTTAQGLAKKLGYTYLDTGAMYRAVALYALRNGLLDAPEESRTAMLSQISLHFEHNDATDHNDIYLNNENVEKEIRQTTLSSQMKPIVTSPTVRHRLCEEQRRIGQNGGIVVDGRDMGTVVFPQAELKLFLVGDREIRVERRRIQMEEMGLGSQTSKAEIYNDIITRDAIDYLGPNAVNKQATDAIVIDTTGMSIEGQINYAYDLAKERLQELSS